MNNHLIAEISATALRRNLLTIRGLLRPSTKLCAVVKADCYGHGWANCGETIAAEADWLAVAVPDEAIAIRHAGCDLPILVLMSGGFLGQTNPETLRELIAADVTLTVTTPEDLAVVAVPAQQVGRRAAVHVKVDGGMTRSGVLAANAPAFVRRTRNASDLELTGIYTHFAASDAADKSSAKRQLERFSTAVAQCGQDATGLIVHAANSAAIIDMPEMHLDMVRLGIAMYGYQPSDEMCNWLPLQPILRVVARITQVRNAPAGVGVGYGGTCWLTRPSRLAPAPIGDADGYRRSFSNRAVMLVRGQFARVCGRVSMDQTILDVTDIAGVCVGDEVEVVSPDPTMPHSVESLARLAGTIPYEITCGLGNRVRRAPLDPPAATVSVAHQRYANVHD